jgi:hypothetical protein
MEPDRFVIEDIAFYRHWDHLSQRFGGGDSLATAFVEGWEIHEPVAQRTYWCGGARQVCVYAFELRRGTETMFMPVVGNPYVDRLVQEMNLTITREEDTYLVRVSLLSAADSPVQHMMTAR